MANPALSTSVPLGQWVDTLLNLIFFQPDDALSASTYEQYVSSDFAVRINHDRLDFTQYYELLKKARADGTAAVQSNDEIQCWVAPDGSGAGCVAHLSHFTLTSKKDGKVDKQSALTLCNVQIQDGKRVLAELTEVTK